MPSRDVVHTAAEAAEQELAPLIILEPLAGYLDARGLGSGPVEANRIGEGHSNITYLIERDGERFVLRRPPRPTLPPTDKVVLREARLLAAVTTAEARAPPVLAARAYESLTL